MAQDITPEAFRDMHVRLNEITTERDGLLLKNEALYARLAELEHASAWQPIVTAPKDGTMFIANEGKSFTSVYTCAWDSAGWYSDLWDEPEPTHWLRQSPLPTPKRPDRAKGYIMPSIVKPAMLLENITWPNDEGCSIYNDNVETIMVTQLAGPMGYYDAARVIFNNGEGDLIVPLHHLSDFRVKPTTPKTTPRSDIT